MRRNCRDGSLEVVHRVAPCIRTVDFHDAVGEMCVFPFCGQVHMVPVIHVPHFFEIARQKCNIRNELGVTADEQYPVAYDCLVDDT